MMSTSVYTGLNPCVNVCHHNSTGLYGSLSAERLSERTVESVIDVCSVCWCCCYVGPVCSESVRVCVDYCDVFLHVARYRC